MKISAGDALLDEFLEGGYEKDIINTIYGPAGAGKTLLCVLALIKVVEEGKKVIYIDTEGGFSIERFKQVCPNFLNVLEKVLFLKPVSFEEQKDSFDKLRKLVNDKIGLIVVDTISMLYRLEIGKNKEVYDINRELGQQLSYLSEIARTKNIPIIVANQVYSDFDNKDSIKIVGGDLLKYSSKCMIEIKTSHNGIRNAILRKHRSIREEKEINFKIVDKGISSINC